MFRIGIIYLIVSIINRFDIRFALVLENRYLLYFFHFIEKLKHQSIILFIYKLDVPFLVVQ